MDSYKKVIECPYCGYKYFDHDNIFGKICLGCSAYIPPEAEIPIVVKNKEIKNNYKKLILNRIKELRHGDKSR